MTTIFTIMQYGDDGDVFDGKTKQVNYFYRALPFIVDR